MFTDPQSVTLDGATISLPRVSTRDRASTYETPNGDLTMNITHTNGKRSRSTVRFDHSKVASDPFNPATNRPYSMSAYITVDTPLNVGYTDEEASKVVAALLAKMQTSGFLLKLLGQES